jgi:transposase-like protein
MNNLPMDKQRAAIQALIDGNSIRSTERMIDVHRDTIMRLLLRVGDGCTRLLDTRIKNIEAQQVQVDEI